MTEDQIAKECERLFQNGGPKVYTYDPARAWCVTPSFHNTKRTLSYFNDSSIQVWSRRKVGQLYRWRKAHTAVAS